MQTAPPARGNYSETVNQWLIYDNYVIYETAKELAEEKENKKDQKESKVKLKGTVRVIYREACPIHNGTLHTFVWTTMR